VIVIKAVLWAMGILFVGSFALMLVVYVRDWWQWRHVKKDSIKIDRKDNY